MSRRRAFTLLELLIVIAIIGLLISILIPALGGAQKKAYRAKNASNCRGIIQAFTLWAEANGIARFPQAGLPSTVECENSDATLPRFRAILRSTKSDRVSPWLLICPAGKDSPREKGTGSNADYPDQSNQVSYALLEATSTDWAAYSSSQAPLVCDKQVGSGSAWNSSSWTGNIGWGDMHVSFEPNHKPYTVVNNTKTGDDDIWASGGALMINP